MDYNPNLIKTVNDSLATLGFSSGQPTSQALGDSVAQSTRCYPYHGTETERRKKATTARQPSHSFFLQLPDLGIDFLFLALNKASNFLTTKMLSPGSLLTAGSGLQKPQPPPAEAAGRESLFSTPGPLSPTPTAQSGSQEVLPKGVPRSTDYFRLFVDGDHTLAPFCLG